MTLAQSIKDALFHKNEKIINNIVHSHKSEDIAEIVSNLTFEERISFFSLIDPNHKVNLIATLPLNQQSELMHLLTSNEFNEMKFDNFNNNNIELKANDEANINARIFYAATEDKDLEDTNELLNKIDNQISSIASKNYFSVNINWSVGEAIREMKAQKEKVKINHYLFCIDNSGVYKGYIPVEELVFSNSSLQIKSLMKSVTPLLASTSKSKATNVFADINMSVLPVVDANNKLIGVVTSDKVIDVVSNDYFKRMNLQSGISYIEEDYTKSSIKKQYLSRVFWLVAIMIVMTFSSIFIDNFISTIEHNEKLVGMSFISTALIAITVVMMDTAGNSAGQSSSLVIRALSTGDITYKQYWQVFRKEFAVAFLAGGTLAVANTIRLILYYAASGDLMAYTNVSLALAIGSSVSMWIIVIIAKLIGATIPVIAKACKLDPAVLSGPVALSMIDIISNMILFSLTTSIILMVI